MATLRVKGGRPLRGRITPSANKNAVLPVLCATLLTDKAVRLHGVPDVTDVRKLLSFFEDLGSQVEADFTAGSVGLRHPTDLKETGVTLPAGMRSAVMLIPGLLHRFGRAVLSHDSKGCTLGIREIDPHIEVFRRFGAMVHPSAEGLVLAAPRGFTPVQMWLDYASVTTTENFIMCAAVAGGRSRLVNAACEPHVQEFCRFLAQLGAPVEGAGASTISIEGGQPLRGAEVTFDEDFHEVATLIGLAAITGGDIEVRNTASGQFGLIDRTFAKFGVEVVHEAGWSRATRTSRLAVVPSFTPHLTPKVEAAPWPYLPADLLPIFIALATRAEGQMLFWNKVYEGALGWTTELSKFGVQTLACDPHRVVVFGGKPLAAAEVESPYIIRAALALLMVAASVDGVSRIHNADPIRRAHPNFVPNLTALGAEVAWEDDAPGPPSWPAQERLAHV